MWVIDHIDDPVVIEKILNHFEAKADSANIARSPPQPGTVAGAAARPNGPPAASPVATVVASVHADTVLARRPEWRRETRVPSAATARHAPLPKRLSLSPHQHEAAEHLGSALDRAPALNTPDASQK